MLSLICFFYILIFCLNATLLIIYTGIVNIYVHEFEVIQAHRYTMMYSQKNLNNSSLIVSDSCLFKVDPSFPTGPFKHYVKMLNMVVVPRMI